MLLFERPRDRLSFCCHITFMKLIHAIVWLGAASLLPSALAQEPASKEALPFSITIRSDVTPISHAAYRYPAYAGVERLEGSCDVAFAISPAGKADNVEVRACTSNAFRRAAKSAVESMTFKPRTAMIEDVRVNIAWNFDRDTGVRTASLD